MQPTNHTHDKELEANLINHNWTTKLYYNDELKDVLLRFNDNHTLDFYYIDTKLPADLYYNRCNIWNWSKEKKRITIECSNTSYSKSYIEIISINEDTLRIKTYNKMLELKRGN